jgi:hypothetical protein
MSPSDDRPFWKSERGEVMKWYGGEGEPSSWKWHSGPIRNDREALHTEHYVIKLKTVDGPRYYTVHYPPTDDFDLDYEIDRIESEYAEDFA